MTPNAEKHNPSPDYLRGLIERAGVSQSRAAELIGLEPRTLRRYLATPPAHCVPAPYPVQFALECLPRGAK